MRLFTLIFRIFRKGWRIIKAPVFNFYAKLLFALFNVKYGARLKVRGLINVEVTREGSFLIGENFTLNSGPNYNPIGRQQKCIFWVGGMLSIGNNVGMSSVAIVCREKVVIGNNVLIGGNTVIYDTNFHSLNFKDRNTKDDLPNAKQAPVIIGDDVFIGAHSTILKGVSIGNRSIIGACSLVTQSIPDGEIWGGSPAKFIKKLPEVNFT